MACFWKLPYCAEHSDSCITPLLYSCTFSAPFSSALHASLLLPCHMLSCVPTPSHPAVLPLAVSLLPLALLQAECTCDICEGHMRHDQLIASMSRSVFCPILPSNTQSSRRLSEAMLTGG